MLSEKDRTLLSSILTATTGVAKTLVSVREEQKEQSKRLDELKQNQLNQERDFKTFKKEIDSTLTSISKDIMDGYSDLNSNQKEIQQLVKDEHRNTVDTTEQTIKGQFTKLIDVLSEDESFEELEKQISSFKSELITKLENHDEVVNNKLNNLNQIKVMKALIESLTTMQKDMSQLTKNMETNSAEFSNLADANRTMAARLDSVDIRMISMIDTKQNSDSTDSDLDALNDVVKLLESQS